MKSSLAQIQSSPAQTWRVHGEEPDCYLPTMEDLMVARVQGGLKPSEPDPHDQGVENIVDLNRAAGPETRANARGERPCPSRQDTAAILPGPPGRATYARPRPRPKPGSISLPEPSKPTPAARKVSDDIFVMVEPRAAKASFSDGPSFAELVAADLVLPGSSVRCYDCSAKVTGRGTLVDDIDLLEYVCPLDWIAMLSRTLKPHEPKPSEMDSWQRVRVAGRPLSDYRELFGARKRGAGTTLMAAAQILECSGLGPDQKTLLILAANTLKGPQGQMFSFSLEADSGSRSDLARGRHLVVATDAGGLVVKRTLKYFEAVLQGSSILSFQWVLESLEHRAWLADASYLVRGDSVVGQSEASRRCLGRSGLLFAGTTFYLDARAGLDWRPPRAELSRLILTGGGKDTGLRPKPLYTLVPGETLLIDKPDHGDRAAATAAYFISPAPCLAAASLRAPQLKLPLKHYVLKTPTEFLEMISLYQT